MHAPSWLTVHISMELEPLAQSAPAHAVVVTGQELLHAPEESHALMPSRHVWQVEVSSPLQPSSQWVSPAGQAQKHWKNAEQ